MAYDDNGVGVMYRHEQVRKFHHMFGHATLLSAILVAVIPMSRAYIDCRISCRRCQENTEHPSVLELYCAMCEECKQRRREKLLLISGTSTALTIPINEEVLELNEKRHIGHNKRISSTVRVMTEERSDEGQHHYGRKFPVVRGLSALSGVAMGAVAPMVMPQPIVIPPACPMPPYCSETEEEVVLRYEDTTTTTKTTTTTTPRPTQSIRRPLLVKKLKRKVPQYQPMMAPMPCMSCMQPMCPMPCPMAAPPITYPPPQLSIGTYSTMQQPYVTTPSDFDYVYIGVPKNVLKS